MDERRRILLLIAVMTVVVTVVGAVSTALLYQTAFREELARLSETAQGQARLLEAMARHDAWESAGNPADPQTAILQQLVDAQARFHPGSRTGEVTVARRDSDTIVFLLTQNRDALPSIRSIPLNSNLAEPMRRALSGRSGTMVGLDYRGVRVLAAYEPVAGLEWGVVAKIDVTEVRAPFYRAVLIAGLCAIALIILAALLIVRVTGPLLHQARENERRYALLFDKMLAGMAVHEIICDAQGKPCDYRFLDVNPAFESLTGLCRKDVIGHTVLEVLPAIEPFWIETYGRVALTGEPVHFTQFSQALDKHYEVTAFCVAPGQFGTVFVDITAHKRAEEEVRRLNAGLEQRVAERTAQLVEANAALQAGILQREQMQAKLLLAERLATLGTISGSIAHEIRNPLGTIDSSIYYLRTRLQDADEKTVTHLTRMKSAVDSALAVIESLLNLTRRKEPNLSPVDLAKAVSQSIVASSVPPAVQVVERHTPGLVVQADPEQLRMVITNIVRNAVEAMSGQGTLTVTTQRSDAGWTESTFADTGPGIPRENLERVFEPLFTTRVRGVGFGLALVKQIVERHGGTVEARSEPGQGAAIVIRLPLAGDDKEA